MGVIIIMQSRNKVYVLFIKKEEIIKRKTKKGDLEEASWGFW